MNNNTQSLSPVSIMTSHPEETAVSSLRKSRRTSDTPKYDMRLNPVYQIDFLNSASGKRLGLTKRRLRWRFGFSNADALRQGLTGVECRGEEHEVTLIWSITSGKRMVMADGAEVHFSVSKGLSEGRFETSWTMSGNHVMKLVAHAAPPLFNSPPGFRQFDLQLDGFSFFEMPRIFELGIKRDLTTPPPPRHLALPEEEYMDDRNYGYEHRSMPAFSDDYLPAPAVHVGNYNERRLSMPSLPSSHHPHHQHHQNHADDRSVASARTVAEQTVSPSLAMTTSTPDLICESAPSDFLDAPVSSLHPYTSDEFAPKPMTVPSPEPTFAAVTNQILQAYGPTMPANGVLALAYESHTHGVPQHQQQQQQQQQQQPMAVTPPPYHHHHHHQHHQQQQYQSPPIYGGTFQEQQQQQQQSPEMYYHAPPSSQYRAPETQGYYQPVTPEAQGNYQVTPVAEFNTPPEGPQPMTIFPTMMKPLNLVEEEDRAQPHLTELERAMKNLVNLEDITETLETPQQIKMKQRQAEQKPLQSKPLPPTAPEWHLGLAPKLAEIKEHKKPTPPTKEVMRVHAFDPAAAQAGMMVIYGQAPPSFPAVSGFGAGMHASHYHYGGGYHQHGAPSYSNAPNSVVSTMAPPAVFAAY